MGNAFSFVRSHGKRLLIKYNALNRAHNFLDKGNLPKAPDYETLHKKTRTGPPSVTIEELQSKDEALDELLKDVYVKSYEPEPKELKPAIVIPLRPNLIPENKDLALFPDPPEIPEGLCTLKEAMQILSEYEERSKPFDPHAVAVKYKLQKEDVENLVQYFGLFALAEKKLGQLPGLESETSMYDLIEFEDKLGKEIMARLPGGITSEKSEVAKPESKASEIETAAKQK